MGELAGTSAAFRMCTVLCAARKSYAGALLDLPAVYGGRGGGSVGVRERSERRGVWNGGVQHVRVRVRGTGAAGAGSGLAHGAR